MTGENDIRNKVKAIYDKISNDFYICRNDLNVDGKRFNSALLFGLLTELNRGKMLLYGEYGGGKTTLAEYLNAIFYNLPIELVRSSAIRADPQKTEEKMIARPNYAKLYGQKEDVVWQHFVLVPGKIIDEFNRLPEPNQDIILNGMDTGRWSYLNKHIDTGKEAFFATCNYGDSGNNDLIPPILDRIDIAVESKFPGVAASLYIADDYMGGREKPLKNEALYRRSLDDILDSSLTYKEIKNKLNNISDEQHRSLLEKGIDTLNMEEMNTAYNEIEKIKLDPDAQAYMAFLIAELNVSVPYGQKRSIDPPDTANGKYLGALLSGSGSRRGDKSIVRYARSLAWLNGKDEVTLEEVKTVAPYVLWHRLNFTDEVLNQLGNMERSDTLQLFAAKTMLGYGTEDIPGVSKRFEESIDNYRLLSDMLKNQDEKGAKEFLRKLAAEGKGHPLFLDIQRELEG